MKTLSPRILRPALLAVAVALVLPIASAPSWAAGQESMTLQGKREAERKARESKDKAENTAAAQYPQATREEPEASASRRGLKALQELVDHAQAMGANAVIAMRYEANEIMEGVTEVLAYGTAVVVEEG